MGGSRSSQVTRRAFLQVSGCGAVAAGVGAFNPATTGPSPQTQPGAAKSLLPTGVLGRTKHPVTLLSFGAIQLRERLGTRVLKLGIDRGLNLVHTSETYGGGASIRVVADLFKMDKRYRDKVFLCVKGRTPPKEAEIDGMLKILGTDHVDVVLTTLHTPQPGRLEDIQARQDKLKKKGKVRYKGFVSHTDMNGAIELVLEKAPDYFDVALIAMRMLPVPGNTEPDVGGEAGERFLKNLKALRAKKVGILSMKSGAQGALRKGVAFFQAHAKAVLQAGADSVLTSFNTFEQIDMLKELDLKSPHLTPAEQKAAAELRRDQAHACLMCGACNKVCPQGLPVSDLMRCRMYHEEYGWYEHARAEYAALGVDWQRATKSCADCLACTGVCPIGLAGPQTIAQIASRFA